MTSTSIDVGHWLKKRIWPQGPEICDALIVFLMALVVSLVYLPALDAGEYWWTDESRHAMDGVFFLDIARDLPWRAPYDYALQYFAQYPALALNWYPPFFAMVEASFFAAFGISEFSARLSILSFALVGAISWYIWAKPLWGRWVAVSSGLLFFSIPGVIHWTRSVMLEVPAVAMIILSVLSFDRYLQRPGAARAVLAGLLLACTLLLKQSTVFILPALLAYALLSGRKALMWRWEAALAYVIVALALAILTAHALKFGAVGLGATVGNLHEAGHGAPPMFSLERWMLYLRTLWQVGGPLLSVLCIIGVIQLALVRIAPQDWLIVSWLVTWYLMATVLFGVPYNAERYTMYVLPALALLACRPFYNFGKLSQVIRWPVLGLISVLVVWNLWKVQGEEPRYVAGYRQAAEYVMSQENPGLILFAGKHDGNFIFNLRALDRDKDMIVLRADKVLVSMAVQKYFGTLSYVKTEEDVLALIDRYGVGLVVIESRDIVGLPEFSMLSKVLAGPQFRLQEDIPVRTNLPEFSNLSLRVYRYLDKKSRVGSPVVIPLPHMGMEIKLNHRLFR
jgi:hypothetical protein